MIYIKELRFLLAAVAFSLCFNIHYIFIWLAIISFIIYLIEEISSWKKVHIKHVYGGYGPFDEFWSKKKLRREKAYRKNFIKRINKNK